MHRLDRIEKELRDFVAERFGTCYSLNVHEADVEVLVKNREVKGGGYHVVGRLTVEHKDRAFCERVLRHALKWKLQGAAIVEDLTPLPPREVSLPQREPLSLKRPA